MDDSGKIAIPKVIPYDQTGTRELDPASMLFYHYTSLDAFCRIVQSGLLWMTNICYMNDTEELLWLFRLAGEGFSKEEKERQPQLTADIVRVVKEGTYGQVYATCFSEDDDSLLQWRAYADDGRGVAMGFRFDKPEAHKHVELHNVIYTAEKERVLLGLCDQTILRRPFADAEARIVAERVFLNHVITCAARIKNDGFVSEREWRLIHLCAHVENTVMGVRQYRESKGLVIPYHAYELARCSRSELCSVQRAVFRRIRTRFLGCSSSMDTMTCCRQSRD